MRDKPLMMAVEVPDLWVKSTHREIHLGHLHTEASYEHMGVKTRRIPAICPPDYYHASNGYVGNIQAGQAFIWSKTDGLTGTIEYSIKNEG